MTERLEELTEAGLTKALAYVEATEGFVGEQAPLLIQEILRYQLFYSGVWAVFWLIIGAGLIGSGVRVWKSIRKENPMGDPCPVFMLGFFGGGGALCGAAVCLLTAAKVVIAPRLFLIEKLKDLV